MALTEKEHLIGLTEIRGIAALIVLVSHIDQFHYLFNTPSLGIAETGFAGHAVTIFFVLSGFLITYLLLKEKSAVNKILIKQFYIRRVLRIWPVYFITLALAIILLMAGFQQLKSDLFITGLLYVTMLSNVAYILSYTVTTIVPLWSIGVEEQFYLIWPWIVNYSKKLVWLLLLIITGYLILKVILFFNKPDSGIYELIKLTRIDCMAIGGFFAILYTKQKTKLIYNPFILILSIMILISPMFHKIILPVSLEIELYAIASGILIINVSTNKKSFLKFNSKILRFLGIISYGIYCYHMSIIVVTQFILINQSIYIVYTANILLTILVSYASYYLIELRLLNLKKRFTVIETIN